MQIVHIMWYFVAQACELLNVDFFVRIAEKQHNFEILFSAAWLFV